jgi:hypothetical protein
MGDIGERIRHRESLGEIMTAEEAALLFRDGMLVATSGTATHPRPAGGYLFTAEVKFSMERAGALKKWQRRIGRSLRAKIEKVQSKGETKEG